MPLILSRLNGYASRYDFIIYNIKLQRIIVEFTGRKESFLRAKIFQKEIKIIKEGESVFIERRELVRYKK